MKPKKPFHEVVAEKLIEQLKVGTAPWQKPWQPGEPNSLMPMNPTTGKRYKGINAIHLMVQGRNDSRWMTYKQAAAAGAQVRKGEKGTPIQYWKFSEEQDKLDDQGRSVRDAKGEKIKETVQLERPRVFFATVFNGEQIDGLPPQQIKPKAEQQWDTVERAEHILKASGAKISHSTGDRAFYRPSTDSITLPEKSQFDSADRYYATALHELGHWTGHPLRLDRDLAHPFGSEGYAKEELRAEISSMIVGDELGIGYDPEQHTAYVGSWIKALQDDPLEIFRASSDAEKIHDYVLTFEQKQVQEQQAALRQPHEMTLAEYPDLVTQFPEARAQQEEETNMQTPINIDGLPGRLVDRLADNGIMSRPDVEVTSALSDLHTDEDISAAKIDREQQAEREYINVPFKEKNKAKGLGARWDRQQQSWYVPASVDATPFAKWAQGAATAVTAPQTQPEDQKAVQGRTYLAVPYAERGEAKVAGALWDKAAKSWYAGPRADMAKLERWNPENVSTQQGPAMTPREEFAEAMKSAGLFVGRRPDGDHPIMDGKKHRVPVERGKAGALDGFYVGHLDGHPAGRIINNKTGTDVTWKSKGYTLSDEEKAKLRAEAATKMAERTAEQEQQQEAAAQRVGRQMASLTAIEQPTSYLDAKGIQPHGGALTDKDGQKTYIPAFDVNGKQWTVQYIQEDGTKRFAKGSKKEGCFHPVGGMDVLAAAPVLVISEGYATAASNAEALGFATVAAFDSGNLPHVARALHEKYPDKPIIIAGDDDKPGRVKAEEAAQAVGGRVIFPIFAPGEQAGDPKGFTDFNDLANKSKLGREGVKRQVNTAVDKVLIDVGQQEKAQKLEKKLEQRPMRLEKAS